MCLGVFAGAATPGRASRLEQSPFSVFLFLCPYHAPVPVPGCGRGVLALTTPAIPRSEPAQYTSTVSARVLLVEDEPGLVLTLTDRLTAEGYRVESVTNGNVALERASGEAFDIILLDVMLPGRDGFDVCRTLRQRGVSAPIMMLTARGQVVDRVVGLRLGADDYLTKPFEMMELLARVEALLRRAPQSPPTATEQFQFGQVRVDFRKAEVEKNGQPLEL